MRLLCRTGAMLPWLRGGMMADSTHPYGARLHDSQWIFTHVGAHALVCIQFKVRQIQVVLDHNVSSPALNAVTELFGSADVR